MNAICKVAVQDPTFRRSCEVLLAEVFQSFNEIRFSSNVRRFFRNTVQAQGKKLAKWRVSSWLQTAQALKFNIALVRSTMRSRYTVHAIVKYKIDLHSTNTQINKQYLQRIEYLYFISKIIIFGRAEDFLARSKRFSIEYNYCYENHETMLRRQLQRKRHIKIELCVGFSVLRLFQVVHDEQNRRSALPFAWHEWILCQGKEWKVYWCGFALSSELKKKKKFHVVVWQTASKTCTKKRAARAARIYLHIFCGAVACSLPTPY